MKYYRKFQILKFEIIVVSLLENYLSALGSHHDYENTTFKRQPVIYTSCSKTRHLTRRQFLRTVVGEYTNVCVRMIAESGSDECITVMTSS